MYHLVPGFWNEVALAPYYVDLTTFSLFKWNGFKLTPIRGERVFITDDEGQDRRVTTQAILTSTILAYVEYLADKALLPCMEEEGLVPTAVMKALQRIGTSPKRSEKEKPAVPKEEPQETHTPQIEAVKAPLSNEEVIADVSDLWSDDELDDELEKVYAKATPKETQKVAEAYRTGDMHKAMSLVQTLQDKYL